MTTLSRRQLYDLIWLKPMRDAAAEIGISDVGLRKVCQRHRVPVPPQGYWNKVHAGQRPPQALFREVTDPRLDRVVIQGARYRPPPEVQHVLVAAQARERQPDHKITVPPVTPPSLPAAVRLTAALKKAKTDERGLTNVDGPKLFRVRVAPASIDRAVTLVEALLKGALERGFAVTAGAAHLSLAVDGEALVLSLRETTKRSDHQRTEAEVERAERRERAQQAGNWDLSSRLYQPEPRWDYRPLGQFALEMFEQEYLSVRERWSDTKTRTLEVQLNDVLAGLVAYAAARKQRREDHARREKEREVARQQAEVARRQAALEEIRVTFLGERLGAYRELAELSGFLAGVTRSATATIDGPLAAFIAWAEGRVEQLRWECETEGIKAYVEHSALFSPAAAEGSNPEFP